MNAEFANKLLNAMQQMTNPKKDKTATVPTKAGGRYTYKYTQLDDVLSIVRPALLDNGIVLLQGVQDDKMVCSVTDGNCTLTLDSRLFLPKGDSQAQGSYETYMRRYQLLTAFGLAGEDDDGAAASPQTQQRYQQRQPQQQQLQQKPQQQHKPLPQQPADNGWQRLLYAFYGNCNAYALDPNDAWAQMCRDLKFAPEPSMTKEQLAPAGEWVAKMRS